MTSSSQAPVDIVDYDPAWPVRFEEERKELERVLRPWLAGPIEHIGSTAVPGLAAKPVVDIMAGVETLESSRDAIEAAATLGYCYFPYQASVRHWMCKPSDAFRTHHLHLVPVRSPQWLRPIAFRNYLRTHHDVAAEYEQLKRALAVTFRLDREAYTEAKSDFIEAITVKALAAGYASRLLPPESDHSGVISADS
jgi:GrpB-like predicted nucleotidyltransferase (UPF0157 family)